MSDADYDLTHVIDAQGSKVQRERSTCTTCQRPMYKEPSWPSIPSEWRHTSSGHAISWTPTKHVAGHTKVETHGHRWKPTRSKYLDRCSVEGCEAEMVKERPPQARSKEPKRNAQGNRIITF